MGRSSGRSTSRSSGQTSFTAGPWPMNRGHRQEGQRLRRDDQDSRRPQGISQEYEACGSVCKLPMTNPLDFKDRPDHHQIYRLQSQVRQARPTMAYKWDQPQVLSRSRSRSLSVDDDLGWIWGWSGGEVTREGCLVRLKEVDRLSHLRIPSCLSHLKDLRWIGQ